MSVNEKHGFLVVNLNRLLSLPSIVVKKVLQSLMLHVGGARVEFRSRSFARLYDRLLAGSFKPLKVSRCVVYSPHKQEHLLVIGRTLPERKEQEFWTPLSLGETIHWDGRWRIRLKPLVDASGVKRPIRAEEQLYVRHMLPKDDREAQRGIRKVRATVLPERLIRGGLPVISNKDGYVVLAPHYGVIDRSYGVNCDIMFDPLLPLTQDTPAYVC